MSRTVKNKKVARLIILMAHDDQRVRKLAAQDSSFCQEVIKVDQENIKRFKKIIKQFGWPSISLVGKRASHLSWLLAQHADSDREFQEQCLRLLIVAEKNKDVNKQEIAFLTDRVLVNKKKPQLYGTQFYVHKNGKTLPRSIRNTKLLEQRRGMMGLESFVSYRKLIERRRKSGIIQKRNRSASAKN